MKYDTNWLQTKDVPPNHRHYCSKTQQQHHPRARAMNPQGQFQSVTWLPKPVNTQALTGFPSLTTIQVPSSLLPNLHHPREWTSTLLFHAVPQAVLLLIRAPTQLVQNLNAGTLRTHSCEKHWTQANTSQTCGLRSWLDHTSDHYNQLSHG
jgi:hypothetical protein